MCMQRDCKTNAPHAAGDEQDVGRAPAGELPEHLAALVERLLRRLDLCLHAAGMEACAGPAKWSGTPEQEGLDIYAEGQELGGVLTA